MTTTFNLRENRFFLIVAEFTLYYMEKIEFPLVMQFTNASCDSQEGAKKRKIPFGLSDRTEFIWERVRE